MRIGVRNANRSKANKNIEGFCQLAKVTLFSHTSDCKSPT